MIDKSIRQHYQTGEEVKKLKLVEMGEKLTSPLKDKYIAQDTGKIKKGEVAKDIGINLAKKAVARKLGVASLNPILGLLSLFGIDPLGWAGRKLTEGGVKQAYQAGMTGSPAEGRELRQLEARRANMLRRKEEGKSYSQKNLDEVTNRINEIKGDPYEFEDRRTAAQRKQIIDQLYEFEDKKTAPLRIPETPEVIIPHDTDPVITKPVYTPPDVSDRHPDIPEPKAPKVTYSSPARPHGNGGGGGDHSPSSAPDRGSPGRGGHHWAKGGRVDKALGGRVRDI